MNKAQLELVKGYLAKAQDKLQVARELLVNLHYDDAVSRAYYAAFHAAQAALISEGHEAETHKGLTSLFGLLLVKTGKIDKKFGKILANLKDYRESGDYESFSFIDDDTARRAVTEAEMFCQTVKEYLHKCGFLTE